MSQSALSLDGLRIDITDRQKAAAILAMRSFSDARQNATDRADPAKKHTGIDCRSAARPTLTASHLLYTNGLHLDVANCDRLTDLLNELNKEFVRRSIWGDATLSHSKDITKQDPYFRMHLLDWALASNVAYLEENKPTKTLEASYKWWVLRSLNCYRGQDKYIDDFKLVENIADTVIEAFKGALQTGSEFKPQVADHLRGLAIGTYKLLKDKGYLHELWKFNQDSIKDNFDDLDQFHQDEILTIVLAALEGLIEYKADSVEIVPVDISKLPAQFGSRAVQSI